LNSEEDVKAVDSFAVFYKILDEKRIKRGVASYNKVVITGSIPGLVGNGFVVSETFTLKMNQSRGLVFFLLFFPGRSWMRLSYEFLVALIQIIVIDLVLAGDNAIVIGLAARNLPRSQQKQVIFWGTAGAMTIRILATLAVVWLLKIPGLLLIGGLIVLWVAFKLLVEEKSHEVEVKDHIWSAVGTIIVADTAMGLDNVLAVAGAAHDHYLLVVIGLLISVPVVVWGSTLFIRLLERFPWVLYIGSGVLAWTAGKMIVDEKVIKPYLQERDWLEYGIIAFLVIGVLVLGRYVKNKKEKELS
jgi:YjbE family integral membrane protein